MDRQKYLNKKFGGLKQASVIYDIIYKAGKEIGIYFQFDKIKKTPNTFFSHKLLALAHKDGKQNQIIESIFYSYFIEGKNIGQIEELISIAAQNNFDIGETNKYLTSDDDQESLLNEEIQAKKMGIRGVPCFIVNKEYVLFGVQNKEKFIELFTNLIKK